MTTTILVLLVFAQDPVPLTESQALLQRAREAIAQAVPALSTISCVQEIRRTRYPTLRDAPSACGGAALEQLLGPGVRPAASDRARVRISVSGAREVFSWPDGSQRSIDSPGELLRYGSYTSGDFIGFLTSIFLHPATRFAYIGDVEIEAETLAEYDYEIEPSDSTYTVGGHGPGTITGYSGKFWLDDNSRLSRLTVHTDCSFSVEIRYQRDSAIALPRTTRLRTISPGGEPGVTEVTWRACGPAPEPTPTGSRLISEVRLTAPLDSSTAWAGDPVVAALDDGTVVHGHLVRVEQRLGRSPAVVLGFEFDNSLPGAFEEVFATGQPVRLPAGHVLRARIR